MKTIFISGLDRTGKTFIGECFSKYKFKVMDLGNIVREQYNTANFKSSLSVYYELYKVKIEKTILQKIESEMKSVSSFQKGVVIIGARSESLKTDIDSKFKERIILFVTSDFETRYKRYIKDKALRPLEPTKTKVEFYENDLRQFNWGLNKFDEDADFRIKNDKNLVALKQEIINLILKNNLND